jgi:hypothetical protein
MNKFNLMLLLGGTVFVASGCKFFKKTEPLAPVTDGTFCFMLAENKDTTRISLAIKGNEVEGTKQWQPNEKDGALGTLKGTRNGNIINAVYSYTIEGSKQSETERFLINGDKLTFAKAELNDPKSNGKLEFKDSTKVTFEGGEILLKADCPPVAPKAAVKAHAKGHVKSHTKGKKHR